MSKFDETIKAMEDAILDIEEKANKVLEDTVDEEKRQKINSLVEKTKTALKGSIDKVKETISGQDEDERIDNFLDKIGSKCQEVCEFAKAKIEEYAKPTEKKINLDSINKEISDDLDKLMSSDVFQKTADFFKELGDNINEYFQRPEVKEAINKAKLTTIDVAQKGLDGLKKVLKADELVNKDEDKKEE